MAKTINIIVALFIGAALAVFGMNLSMNAEPQHVEGLQSIRCEMCGAHILEWWQVRNDANTAFINICEPCYKEVRNNG